MIRLFRKHLLATVPALVLVLGLSAQGATAATVIVELNEPPAAHFLAEARQQGTQVSDAELAERRAELRSQQSAFLDRLTERGVDFSLAQAEVFDYDGGTTAVDLSYTLVLNGLVLDVADADVATVESMPAVKRVHPEREYRVLLNKSVDYVRAPSVYGDFAELTAFDDHREGFEGQGIDIAVIDTGIEWTHEMFGGDATPPRLGIQPPLAAANNHEKVIYYMPLVDGAIDDFGHGTHVAATAGGYLGFAPGPDGLPLTDDDIPMHGVAPQARLMGYKVCNAAGSCLTSDIILAIEDAASPRTVNGLPKPVAEVINMSLGGSGGPDDATAQASDNAALAGVTVVAAAGNSGPGDKTVGSPAAGRRVIAVAAHNDDGVFPNSVTVVENDDAPRMTASQAPDSNAGSKIQEPVAANYVYAGTADTPDQVPLSVAGNICLTIRGSTLDAGAAGTGLFSNKAANCEAKGAVATVIFNNEPGPMGPILAPATQPVFSMAGTDGQFLMELGFDAAGISNFEISLNPEDPALFEPMIAGFSSRGPVRGKGQVKPDIAAPGVDILAATSPVGVPAVSMQDPTRYTAASGTSMATPHSAGAAALVKQAHLDWTPDEIRAALTNTASNGRTADGISLPDGDLADEILAQGGGLIDVFEAVNAKALMGVPGDGIVHPTILASHSFGEVPAVDSRVTHTVSAEAIIRDTSGEGGVWNLHVANNRDLQREGLSASVSPSTVSAGEPFSINATIDGDVVRETGIAKGGVAALLQMQWYVIAERQDGGETLRMPVYMEPKGAIPLDPFVSEQSDTTSDVILGDANQGVVFVNVPVDIDSRAFTLDATLEFPEPGGTGAPSIGMTLFGPQGNFIASAEDTGPGRRELSYRVEGPATYTLRVEGNINVASEFTVTATQQLGPAAPTMATEGTEFTNSGGDAVDFDGSFTLTWNATAGAEQFEIERSTDGGDFEVIAEVDGGTSEIQLTDQPEGVNTYRVRAFYPAEIGFFVTPPDETLDVVVDNRSKVDITEQTKTAVSNVAFADGVFAFDLNLTNEAAQDYLPLVEFNVVNIDSASGTVEVINADNGGSGTSADDPALFDYSNELGDDDTFSAGETTGSRHLEFRDEQAELFTFDAVVTAFESADATKRDGSGSTASSKSGDGIQAVLRFTVNPLTGAVNVELVELDGLL